MVGRRGWLFGVDEEEVERLSSGRRRTDTQSLEGLVEYLERTARVLHDLQVRYVVAVVPTKLAVHRGLAPKRLVTKSGRRRTVALTRLARDLEHLDILDLLPALRDATAHGLLFHARDEGLNSRGAFFAQRALLKHAGLAAKGLRPLPLERAKFAPNADPPTGLEAVQAVELDAGGLVPCALPRAPEGDGSEDVADPDALQAVRVSAGTHLEIAGLPEPHVYQHPEAADVPRAILLGHPVIDALTPWIAEATSRLLVLSTPQAPLEQIELELPHVVLHVLEERLLDGEASAHHVVEGEG